MSRRTITALSTARLIVTALSLARLTPRLMSVARLGLTTLSLARLTPREASVARLDLTTLVEVSGAPPVLPPVNATPPVASGVVRIGELLTTTDGTWTGTPAPTYTYQWRRDGVDIGGATASTHTVVAADMAAEIDCVVTASNGVSPDADAASNALASPWRAILLMGPEIVWAFDDQPVLTIGDPVPALIDVYGVALTNIAPTAQQGTYQAGAVRFDGVDDGYTLAAPGDLASLAALNRTGSLVLAHTTDYEAVIAGGLDKIWFGAGAGANAGSRVLLAYVRRDTFVSLGRSSMFFDTSSQRNFTATTGPAATPVVHVETYNAAGVAKHLLTSAGRVDEAVASGIGAQTSAPTIVTIGTGVNAGARSFFRNGDLRFIAHFGRVLTSTEIDTIRSVMIANGVI